MAKVVVIGGGITGLSAAHYLQKRHAVTLVEKEDRLGGHTNPRRIVEDDGREVALDTGFIVFNEPKYPCFIAFLREIDAYHDIAKTEMSLCVFNRAKNLHYATGSLAGFFSQTRNLFRPSFYRLIGEIARYRRNAPKDLRAGKLAGKTIRELLSDYSDSFAEDFLLPMIAILWSVPDTGILDHPAHAMVKFFEHHQHFDHLTYRTWRTFKHSSAQYLDAFQQQFEGDIRLGNPIAEVNRDASDVTVTYREGERERFDYAVLATHADVSLKLLAKPSEQEQRILSEFQYTMNTAYLHTDASTMSPIRRGWASWNVTVENGHSVFTYYLNHLQQLRTKRDYFVTLNWKPTNPNKVLETYKFHHPRFTLKTLDLTSELQNLNRDGPVFFCGSYFGDGFHEDAVKSSMEVVARLTGDTFAVDV